MFEYNKLKSIRAVTKKLGYNRKTIQRWVLRMEQEKQLVEVEGRGRKKALDAAGGTAAATMLLSGDYASAQEVAEQLHKQGITKDKPLHPTTVIRHAKAASIATGKPIVAVSGKPNKLLTPDTKQKRLEFCEQNKSTTWSNIMFTDRKKFYFRYPGTRVNKYQWVVKGEQRVAFAPNHPSGFNIYAGITPWGITKPHVVTGTTGTKSTFTNQKGQPAKNITSQEYQQVLKQTLIPEGKRLFNNSKGISSWVLQQDNDPTHKKASALAVSWWNKKHPGSRVKLMAFWPPNSPDLSPIENVWAYVQAKADKAGCLTFSEYQAIVVKTLKEVPHKMLANLYKSMTKRLLECKQKSGGKTKY